MQMARLCSDGWRPFENELMAESPANEGDVWASGDATRRCDSISSINEQRATARSNLIECRMLAGLSCEAELEATGDRGFTREGLKAEIRTSGETLMLNASLMQHETYEAILTADELPEPHQRMRYSS